MQECNHRHRLLRARRQRPRRRRRPSRREIPAASCPPRGSGDGIVSAQTSTLKGAETGFATQHEMLADVRYGSLADICGAEPMSALPPIADIRRLGCDVRFVPIAAICTAANNPLFDHLVGADQDGQRKLEARRPRRFQVNRQLKLSGPINREIAWLVTFEIRPV